MILDNIELRKFWY